MVNTLVILVLLGATIARYTAPRSRRTTSQIIDWLGFIPLASLVAYLVVRFIFG